MPIRTAGCRDSDLTALHPGMHKDEATQNAFKVLLEKGALGSGVLQTLVCRATYAELKTKG